MHVCVHTDTHARVEPLRMEESRASEPHVLKTFPQSPAIVPKPVLSPAKIKFSIR